MQAQPHDGKVIIVIDRWRQGVLGRLSILSLRLYWSCYWVYYWDILEVDGAVSCHTTPCRHLAPTDNADKLTMPPSA